MVTSVGADEAVAHCLAAAAPSLAAVFELPLLLLEDREPPAGQLAALAAAAPPRLLGLPVDPGRILGDGSHWAEALGAWRQPTVVLLPAAALSSGAPAAVVALLRQWRVPLLGLVQDGGDWEGGLRRRDGLPWLGWLPSAPAEGADHEEAREALRHALDLRRQELAAELA